MSRRGHRKGRTVAAAVSRLCLWAVALLVLLGSGGCAPAAQELPAGPWTRGVAMPTARSELAAAALDGRIYAAGGIAQLGTTNAFEVYDPTADRWEELPPVPEDLHHLAAAAIAGRIYVTGGYTDVLFQGMSGRAFAYDPATRSWTRIADMPGPRAAHGMAALGGMLYVIGGVGSRPQEVWAYDPATDAWATDRAPLPTRREHLAVAALEDRLYAVGGRWDDKNVATLEIYDPASDGWRRGPDMPTPRSGLTAVALGGRLHVTGGESLETSETFAAHEAYDPKTESWASLAELPTPRHGLASATLGERWYVIGGGAKAGALTFVSLTDVVEVFAGRAR
jgi:N-acetylneuraminic acid mutarotase